MMAKPMDGLRGGPSAPRFAGPARRLLALGLDGLVVGAYLAALTAVTMAASRAGRLLGLDLSWPRNPVFADLTVFVSLILPIGLYFALSESSARQATWGKRKAGLLVVGISRGRLPFGRAVLRAIFKLLPWQIAHTSLFHIPGWPWDPSAPPAWVYAGFGFCYALLGANIALLLLSSERAALHDRVAGSRVIYSRRETPI